MTIPHFKQVTLQGEDAATFLQNQITADVKKLSDTYLPTAIANLKGRIQFGIWLKKRDEQTFDVVINDDCLADFSAHVKKFGAFSKFKFSEAKDIYPAIDISTEINGVHQPIFSTLKERYDVWEWMRASVAVGNYWITAVTQTMFQPQELRLHQRAGVDYDKGCYLGQEVIARLYFKATPKAYLHRISAAGATPDAGEKLGKIRVVNAVPNDNSVTQSSGFEALVVARPEDLAENSIKNLSVLELPEALQQDVGRD